MPSITPLEPQFRFGDKSLNFQVVLSPKRDCGSKRDKTGPHSMVPLLRAHIQHFCFSTCILKLPFWTGNMRDAPHTHRRYRQHHRYRYRYRYGLPYHTEKLVTFGTVSIPVPRSSVRSVRNSYRYRWCRYDNPYRYREVRYVRYDVRTGTEKFGTFGTMSIPVPRSSVRSVRCPYRYRAYPYLTEHNLGSFRVTFTSNNARKISMIGWLGGWEGEDGSMGRGLILEKMHLVVCINDLCIRCVSVTVRKLDKGTSREKQLPTRALY